MAKPKSQFICQACGAIHNKWSGKCEACGEWNTLSEEALSESAPKGLGGGTKKGRRIEFTGLKGEARREPRRTTGIGEFDRVTGGGMVPGSAILVGGDPGIGKSTILMQVAARIANQPDMRAAYISGEESVSQLRLRAERLNLAAASVELAVATNVRDIVATLDIADAPELVIIDSIQTMYVDTIESAPGTVSQVRSSAQELIRLAKRRGFALVLVGHVTKEGQIAGPRVLEHMVDTVLYFEGDRGHQFRILRAVKNRFGPTDEIGVFEMTDGGLSEVENPSALFLSERERDVTGAAVFAGIEGTRPMLVEIQSLSAPSALGTPRRAVVGWEGSRLSMVIAVLEARLGLALGGNDVYLNVAGGLKVSEPACDLAVAAALMSGLTGVPVPPETVIFGEIGLSGEVRAVAQTDQRLKEAEKLGFTRAILPKSKGVGGAKKAKAKTSKDAKLEHVEIQHLNDLLALFEAKAPAGGRAQGGPRG